jgi:hormone-sensitive lipase
MCSLRAAVLVLSLKNEKNKLKSVLTARKMSRSFRKLETWTNLAEKLEIILQVALDMKKVSAMQSNRSLFLSAEEFVDTEMERKMFDLASIHQDAFYGRTCGFQFCESLRLPLTFCAVAFSSCHDAYAKYVKKHADLECEAAALSASELEPENNYEIGDFLHSILRSKKYAANPELRSRQMSHIVKTTSVDFCKAFWQLTETSVFQVIIIKS